MILNKKEKRNSEIGATLGQTKPAYKNSEIGERVHGLVFESNFFFLSFSRVTFKWVSFLFFFALCQGVTRIDYICKDILGVKKGRGGWGRQWPPSPHPCLLAHFSFLSLQLSCCQLHTRIFFLTLSISSLPLSLSSIFWGIFSLFRLSQM